MLNKKALSWFLGLTFGVTITLIIIARLLGFTLYDAPSLLSQMVILIAMFVPALSAIITQKFIVRKPLRALGLRLGPKSTYLQTYGLIVLLYIVNYAVVWLFFLKPDFTLQSFMNQFQTSNLQLPMPAVTMILLLTILTFIGAPIFNFIPSLGEEIGWRGFLLPALAPLGKTKAAILSGLIWGLWHTPMILLLGFLYGQQYLLGALIHLIMVTSVGIWFGYIWFTTKSTFQAAFMHAIFNANAYGVWVILFVSNDKLLIGAGSIFNALLWIAVAIFSILRLQNMKDQS